MAPRERLWASFQLFIYFTIGGLTLTFTSQKKKKEMEYISRCQISHLLQQRPHIIQILCIDPEIFITVPTLVRRSDHKQ